MFKYLPHMVAGLVDEKGREAAVTLGDLLQIAQHLARAEREEKCLKDKEVEKTLREAPEQST